MSTFITFLFFLAGIICGALMLQYISDEEQPKASKKIIGESHNDMCMYVDSKGQLHETEMHPL